MNKQDMIDYSRQMKGDIFTIKPQKNGINVNEKMPFDYPFKHENEIAIPNSIPKQRHNKS